MPARIAEGALVNRLLSIVAACALLVVAGCKEPQPGQPQTGLVTAGTDVVIQSFRAVQAPENNADAFQIYIVKLTYTNNSNQPFVPLINHFVLEDAQKIRHTGTDTGSTALVGISNYSGALKPGESHDYTIGFPVSPNTSGIVFYDPVSY